jgi:hypothetical protein
MRLKEMTVSGFRGFNDKQTLRFDKNVILIKGSNGSGKSSLVEALEWLFFDEISRKRKSPCKSEYVGDFLRNLHCEKKQETFVEVLVDIDGKEIKLKKKLLSPEKKEYYIDDSPVEDFSSLGINFSEVYKPILSQVETKHYVETDPKDRWEETNKILGLGILSELRTDLQELLNSKKSGSRYESSKKILYGIEGELKEFSELQELSTAMQHRPFSLQTFKEELINNIKKTYSIEIMALSKLGQAIDKEILKLARRSENFEAIQALIVPDYNISAYSTKLIEHFKKLLISLKGLKVTNVELHNFLEIGKKLICDHTCPFCLEKTLTDEKLRLIDGRIKETKDTMQLLSDIDSKMKEIRQLKDNIIQGATVFPTTFAIEQIKEKISKSPEYVNEVKKTDEITAQISSSNETLAALDAELEHIIHEIELIEEGGTQFDETKFGVEIDKLEKDAEITEKILSQLRDDVKSLLGTLMSKTPTLSTKEKIELNKALLFRKMIDHTEDIKYIGIYETNMKQISDLIEEVEKFEKAESGKLLKNLTTQIKNFYSKLNPNEKIQFSEIVPTKGKSRRIRIKATSFGKDMNPVSCFSESHMNCLCLSVYFSQRVLNNPYWKFLVLDDPIQTMDENHAKNLIRILIEIAKEKQVIVLSYNTKFCQDFRDLFYGIDYLFYEFSGYSKNGPRIDLKQAPFDTYITVTRKYYDGNMEERAIAANNLRKAIERFTLDMLVRKGKMGSVKASELKLDERLDKIETLKLLTSGEIGEIKAILNVCDAGSHEPPKREVTPTELLDGTVTMENLASKYLK